MSPLLTLIAFVFMGCIKDNPIPSETALQPVKGKKTIPLSSSTVTDRESGRDYCNCSYQVVSVSAAPLGTVTGGVVDYYLLSNNYCSGTFDASCTFSAYNKMVGYGTSIDGPCQCYNSAYIDLIQDDGIDSTLEYPTVFYPFNCGVDYSEAYDVIWEPTWYGDNCTGNTVVDVGATITFKIRCTDTNPESPDACLGYTFVTPPITLTFDGTNYPPTTSIEMQDYEGCHCRPVEVE